MNNEDINLLDNEINITLQQQQETSQQQQHGESTNDDIYLQDNESNITQALPRMFLILDEIYSDLWNKKA